MTNKRAQVCPVGLAVNSSTCICLPSFTAGFGLGALNDADEDDIDVYDRSLKHSRRHMAYDISEHDDGDRIVIGSNKNGVQHKQAQVSFFCHPTFDTLIHTFKRSTSSAQNFQDGRLVLTGFVLSDKPVTEDRWWVCLIDRALDCSAFSTGFLYRIFLKGGHPTQSAFGK